MGKPVLKDLHSLSTGEAAEIVRLEIEAAAKDEDVAWLRQVALQMLAQLIQVDEWKERRRMRKERERESLESS